MRTYWNVFSQRIVKILTKLLSSFIFFLTFWQSGAPPHNSSSIQRPYMKTNLFQIHYALTLSQTIILFNLNIRQKIHAETFWKLAKTTCKHQTSVLSVVRNKNSYCTHNLAHSDLRRDRIHRKRYILIDRRRILN